MNTAELNLLYWIDMPPGPLDISLLLGGRYLDIRDQFNLVAINAVQENRLQVNTVNPLWCLQVGLSSDWLVAARMWVNFTIKGGICNNHASLDNNFTTTAGGVSTINLTSATQDRTAWLGDLNLTANLQMTPWLSARIGYQALFVNGVAVAADNVQTNNALLINGPAQVNARSNAIFHGPLVGIMGTW
jgi:putative beta barrel porin BBP7